MVGSFLNALNSLCTEAGNASGTALHVECRHFFSGAAAYVDGLIFMSLTPVGLALKLPEETRSRLVHDGAKPLRYFPKGPIKKDYVVVPDSIADDMEKLAPLIRHSLEYTRSLPHPRKQAKAKKR